MSLAGLVETVTADEFARLPEPSRAELIAGKVVEMAPAGAGHGSIAMQIAHALCAWNDDHQLGTVAPGDCGFILSREPDTVRVPDVAFISWARLRGPVPDGFYPMAPDLAVEVVSPTDRRGDVMAKISDWLNAGTQLVWVVWPRSDSLWVCRADADPQILGPTDELRAADLLPGFALSVSRILGAARCQPPPEK